jgi:uncharacterized paraquat-inducible protein A
MLGVVLIILLAIVAGSVPTVAVALYFLWDGGPRPFRPWHVARGTRSRFGQPVFLLWIFAPIWLGVIALLFVAFLPLFERTGTLVLGVALYWATVSSLLGWVASWIYKSRWVGWSVGIATFATPVVGWGLAQEAASVLGLFVLIIPALIWNAWVISTIVVAESSGLHADRDHCHNCGYDLTGLDADRCPECGEPCAPARIEAP